MRLDNLDIELYANISNNNMICLKQHVFIERNYIWAFKTLLQGLILHIHTFLGKRKKKKTIKQREEIEPSQTLSCGGGGNQNRETQIKTFHTEI